MIVISSPLLGVRGVRNWSVALMAIGLLISSHANAHARYALEYSIVSDTARTSHAPDGKKTENKVLELFGFIKYDLFADTRQVVNAREGLVSMYPKSPFYDADGNDINAGLNLNMLSIHSRLGLRINGPTFLGGRSLGVVEADFYGNENQHFSDLNGLRLFNAYVKINWKTTELLVGQYWHPMSVPAFFPSTVSFSAGAPFHPMSRNPQILIRQSLGRFSLTGAILSQRDFTSTGPDGPSSQYLRNSGIPNLHLQAQYGNDSSALSLGAGVDYKKIVPTLYSRNREDQIFKTRSTVSSIAVIGFVNVKTKPVTVKAQGSYAENGYDLLMIGGIADSSPANLETGEKTYANLSSAAVWIDAQTTLRRFTVGIFGGYTKNLGAHDNVNGEGYGRGMDIGAAYRVSPRMVYSIGGIAVALEGEYTVAAYGKANGNSWGGVTETNPVANFRYLLSLKYVF